MHGQEPPPVSILEKLTAKGGDTLGRTIENFQPPPARAEVANGASDSEGEGSKTPNESKMDVDEPGSGGGRVTRGKPIPHQLNLSTFANVLNQRTSSSTSPKTAFPARRLRAATGSSFLWSPPISSTRDRFPYRLQLRSVIKP